LIRHGIAVKQIPGANKDRILANRTLRIVEFVFFRPLSPYCALFFMLLFYRESIRHRQHANLTLSDRRYASRINFSVCAFEHVLFPSMNSQA